MQTLDRQIELLNQPAAHLAGVDLARTVSVAGPLTTKVVNAMLGRFHELGQQSSSPITLCVGSSKGGSLDAFYQVDKFFRSSVNKGVNPCRLISVVQGQAHSVAAFLGVMGHPSFAGKSTQLTFHGVRCADYQKGMILTREDAMIVACRLQDENRKIARGLAEAIAPRITQRFLAFNAEPQQSGRSLSMQRLAHFVQCIGQRLVSEKSRDVAFDALEYSEMMEDFYRRARCAGPGSNRRDVTGCMKFLSSHSHELIADNRVMNELAAMEIVTTYFALREVLCDDNHRALDDLCKKFGQRFLSAGEMKVYARILRRDEILAENYLTKKVKPALVKLWRLALALSSRLLVGQTTLCANDAFGLGLIDEIIEPPADVSPAKPCAGLS